MTEVDYESLSNASPALNMLAGAMAGITEHTLTFPLDSIKTRSQFFKSKNIDQAKKITSIK